MPDQPHQELGPEDHSGDTTGIVSLPLRDAVYRWCDKDLIGRLDVALAGLERLGPPLRQVIRSTYMYPRAHASNQAVRSDQHARAQARQKIASATSALVDDLRRKLEDGVLHLNGVQTKPTRSTRRAVIPGIWAADMCFDFNANTVTIDDQRFSRVRAERAGPQFAQRPVLIPVHIDVVQLSGTDAEVAKVKRQGRENTGPLVKEALRACPHLVADWQGQASERRFNKSDAARALLRWLLSRYGTTHKNLPSFETIRKKLPSIYQQTLSE